MLLFTLTSILSCLAPLQPGAVVELTLNPTQVELLIGDTARLIATAAGIPSERIRWSTNDPAVATVDPTGLVRAHTVGFAIVRASIGRISTEAKIRATSVIVHPNSARLRRLDTLRLSVVVVDAQGDTIRAPRVTWSTSDTSLLQIDSNSVVHAQQAGSGMVSASSGSDTGVVMIEVTNLALVGAGDIADCASLADEATALLLDEIEGVVFTAGDNAYPNGSAEDYATCYEPSWGRHKSRTRPSPGNHDYNTPDALGYFTYFGVQAGVPGKGFYSYDIGDWHVIVINSLIDVQAGSEQEQWLRTDLAASKALCTVAYWHYPLFSSGMYAVPAMRPAWQALYDAGADVVVSGHDHVYERFAPQRPDGTPDSSTGIRQFTVGTGGRSLHPIVSVAPNSEVRDNRTFGVLRLLLLPNSYKWEFVPIHGGVFRDAGADKCH